MSDHQNHDRVRSGRRTRPGAGGVIAAVLAAVAPALPLVPLAASLSATPTACSGEDHPRWKEFVIWLIEKKRTPEEDLILRHILSGARRIAWLDVYSHSMQEQVEALFRRWLDHEGNPRRGPDLGTKPSGDTRH